MTVSDYIATHLKKMRKNCDTIAFRFRMDKGDHFQNCIVTAIRLGKSYVHESDNGFWAWWGRLCYHQAINVYRKEKREPYKVDAIYAHHIPGERNRMDDRNALASIYWNIRRRFGTRNSLIMYMVSHRYNHEEIAKILSMPDGTVKSAIHRCRAFLSSNPINPLKMAKNPESNSDIRVKKCRGKCDSVKSLDEFNNNKNKKDGKQDTCKKCQSDFMRDYNTRKAIERKNGFAGPAGIVANPTPIQEHIPEKKVNSPFKKPYKMVKINRSESGKAALPQMITDFIKPAAAPHTTIAGIDLSEEEKTAIKEGIAMKREHMLKFRQELDENIARLDSLIEKMR